MFVQLPTGNGEHYDNLLINKLRAYNTKICVLLHQTIEYEYILNSVDLIMPTSNEVHAYLKEHNYTNVSIRRIFIMNLIQIVLVYYLQFSI